MNETELRTSVIPPIQEKLYTKKMKQKSEEIFNGREYFVIKILALNKIEKKKNRKRNYK